MAVCWRDAARVHGSRRAFEAGEATIADGPYAKCKEQMGGFWIIEAADLDAALDWAKRGAAASEGPVEVRPSQG